MKVVDMHCDTLLGLFDRRSKGEEIGILKNDLHIDLDKMKKGEINRVLLVATGALMSTTFVNEKNTIPAIAHAISLEVIEQ